MYLEKDIDINDTFENLNQCFILAKTVNVTDVVNMSYENIGTLVEIIYRLQNCPQFEMIKPSNFEA